MLARHDAQDAASVRLHQRNAGLIEPSFRAGYPTRRSVPLPDASRSAPHGQDSADYNHNRNLVKRHAKDIRHGEERSDEAIQDGALRLDCFAFGSQ